MSDILISKENIEAILTPIVQDMYTKINALDLSDADKAKLQILNYIVTTGDGTKFLTDNGTYQSVDLSSLNTASDKINVIYDLFQISGSTYSLTLPSDLQAKFDLLTPTGDGSKVLTDNGSYQDLVGILVSTLTDTEVNTIINDTKALL